MNIRYDEYYKKLSACYMGKAIGGTLGMPFEGKKCINNITFYNPYPEKMCGNDDLDLQLLLLEEIYKDGLPINSYNLSKAWQHLHFGPDEYGIALYNLKSGINPPISGIYCNKFGKSMGGAIRSELWASLAPGAPELAVKFAIEDSSVDHYDDGINASIFLTAIESAAYIEPNHNKLLEIGLSFIPNSSKLSKAIKDTTKWWNDLNDYLEVREYILQNYNSDNFTDAVINICFIILGLLSGDGDFDKSICNAVNCGYDTDCTAASLASLLGIIDPECIDEKWSKPIGNNLIISPQIIGLRTVKTVPDLCSKIAVLMHSVFDYYQPNVKILDFPNELLQKHKPATPWSKSFPRILNTYHGNESIISTYPLLLKLNYPKNVAISYDKSETFSLSITNTSDINTNVAISIKTPVDYTLSEEYFKLSLNIHESKNIVFNITFKSKYKAAFDYIAFKINVNGINYNVKAGLISAFPWVKADKNVFDPAYGFIRKIPKGKQKYIIQAHPPMSQQVALTCQGTRPLQLFLNGEKLLEYDAAHYLPSLHRGYSVLGNLSNKWNEIVIDLADGEEGELFFSVGDPINWIPMNNIEWREPIY